MAIQSPWYLLTMGPEELPSQAVLEMIAKDEASRSLGIEVTYVAPHRATARMVIRKDMLNGHGIAHGGLIFTLADTAFACACNAPGPLTLASRGEITFISPARLGDDLVAEAALRTSFGKSGIYDVAVKRGNDVIAEFRGHSHQVSAGKAPAGKAPADKAPEQAGQEPSHTGSSRQEHLVSSNKPTAEDP